MSGFLIGVMVFGFAQGFICAQLDPHEHKGLNECPESCEFMHFGMAGFVPAFAAALVLAALNVPAAWK